MVYAHPNPKSYTHAVLEAVQAGLGERCEVQTLDLYGTGFDPVLVVDETRRRRDLDQVEETRALREQLAWCDAMLFVYPVWWGGFPAMLNGYLDRTFVSGLTYSFEGRPRTAVFPHGLMRDKEAHLFYTLDSPWLFALLDPGWFSNLFTVFWYCGFRRVRRYYLARLKLRTDEQRARWLVTVREHAGRIAERLAGPNFALHRPDKQAHDPNSRYARNRSGMPRGFHNFNALNEFKSLLKGLIVTTSNR